MKRSTKPWDMTGGYMAGHDVFGIPVYYDPNSEQMADARGLWPFKRIVVGPLWMTLTAGERMGVLMHEVKHCLGFHFEIRLLLLPFFWTNWVLKLARNQELDCDAFAVEQGYGNDLLRIILRFGSGEYYPSIQDRCDSLVEHLHALA